MSSLRCLWLITSLSGVLSGHHCDFSKRFNHISIQQSTVYINLKKLRTNDSTFCFPKYTSLFPLTFYPCVPTSSPSSTTTTSCTSASSHSTNSIRLWSSFLNINLIVGKSDLRSIRQVKHKDKIKNIP